MLMRYANDGHADSRIPMTGRPEKYRTNMNKDGQNDGADDDPLTEKIFQSANQKNFYQSGIEPA